MLEVLALSAACQRVCQAAAQPGCPLACGALPRDAPWRLVLASVDFMLWWKVDCEVLHKRNKKENKVALENVVLSKMLMHKSIILKQQ